MKVFDLVIYAVVALAIIVSFLYLIQNFPPKEEPIKLIKTTIQEARLSINLGKLYSLEVLDYKQKALIDSINLAEEDVLVSIECNDPNICCIKKSDQGIDYVCEKSFEWDYDYLLPLESKKAMTFVRCVNVDKISTCKVYLGTKPAEAKIFLIENIGENSLGHPEIKTTLTNSGQNNLTNGYAKLELFKKFGEDWERVDYETEVQEINSLQIQEKKDFFWEIKSITPGEYQAKIIFEAQNGGIDSTTIDFNKTISSFCHATTIGETIYDASNNNYREMHNCEGCNFMQECLEAWNKKTPSITYYPISKEEVYCVKNNFDEAC